jgi:hypothetical protein
MEQTPLPELTRAKKIGFSVFLIVVIGLLLEGGSRLVLRYRDGFDGHHLMAYAFDPYKNVLPTPNYRDLRGLRINSQGFRRDSEVPRAKPPGTYRIFLMGGSTAYGTGGLWPHIQRKWPVLKNSETIDHYLEQMLNDSLGPTHVEVINAAIPSIWMHHHLIYLNQTILNFHPDMVLFLDGFNDWYFIDPNHDQFASYAYQETSRVIMGPPTLYSLAYMDAWWLYRKSALAHLVIEAARSAKWLVFPPPKNRQPLNVEQALAVHRTVFEHSALPMIDRIAVLLKHEGVHAVFMQQPQLILERGRTQMPAIEHRLFDFDVASWWPGWEEFMHRAVPETSERVRQVVQADGEAYLDLTGIFRDMQGQVFTDYAHLTPAANRLLATDVMQYILPTIRGDLHAAATHPPGP